MALIDKVRKAITINETDGKKSLIYSFSDPDGIRTGKSGYSFGCCQFDIFNNMHATEALRDCGFTNDDIARLRAQDGPINDLNNKLLAAKSIVDKWDASELQGGIDYCVRVLQHAGIQTADEGALVHVIDYNNQFGMSPNGKFVAFARSLGRPVTRTDVLNYKLTLPWGQKRPDDVRRRYKNICKVCEEKP